ncbi:MAG: hemolysin family protein [Bifidobacteriaceae bacterium]|jgi:CBS domain containing-hemolysin-like protein|nr:hemolysin family protein [Bifidobacteriaceae bacterium]
MTWWAAILVAIALLLLNAYFVAAEFALMSVRRSQIEEAGEGGDRRAPIVLGALEQVSQMLTLVQLGVTVASTGLGAVAEPALAHVLSIPLERFGMSGTHAMAAILALIVVIYLHVVIGEVVPKNLALAGPARCALVFVPPLAAVARLLRPVVRLLTSVAGVLVRMAGADPRDEVRSAFTADEVASMVARSTAEGVLDDAEGLVTGSLEFSDLTAADVMVATGALVTVPPDVTPEQVERRVAQTGFSRFPVADSDGRLVGYVHVMDVLDAGSEDEGRHRPLPSGRMRALPTVAPAAEVEDVLAAMQRTGAHLAEVTGARHGVVFLEDILEELVGEVRDSMQRRD